jgi:NAD(P)-dependent dehydrogenase (short-subunit alcohol dehydrogenase family)
MEIEEQEEKRGVGLTKSKILNPKSIVISGASSGIGLALARHYLERGATVAAFARRGELLQALAAEFPEKVFCYTLDVRDTLAIQRAARDFMARVGVPDIVIANAGVSRGTLTEYIEDEEVFQNVMDVNVLGMVKTFQPFLTAMREAKQGTLVGIASVAGFRGLPGSSAYSASKAAAISYMESLRVEMYGSGVKVVTLCPGYIRTPMTDINTYPMPFILEVDDAARRMARVIAAGTSFAVVPWQMGVVGWLMKRLPNWLYDRLFAKAPHKARG